ncbi:hypothetical protein ID866_6541 [Astraeus odoratus]|nr:hypothetical protein ID866_6541 [Astraeus odoratus]
MGQIDRTQLAIQMSDIKPDDMLIIVLGTTGSGMSNFINKLAGLEPEAGASTLTSCTRDVCAYACDSGGQRFVFVDTPGFNGDIPQSVLLKKLATYQKSIIPTGIIYTHRITDTHYSGSTLNAFQLLSAVCGNEAADRVQLITTMWDDINDESEAMEREYTLKNVRWSSLLAAGAHYERFNNTLEGAWDVIRRFGDTRKALLLQKELIDKKMSLDDTAAGRQLQRQRDTMEGVALFSKTVEPHQNDPRPIIDVSKIESNDNVILVLGTTGSGMSNFINKLTGMPAEHNAQDLTSCTTDVRAYPCYRGGRRFVFVDTPGFKSVYSSQNMVLKKLAEWLDVTNQRSIKPTGLIYTRRITEHDRTGAELSSFQALYRLCGHDAADRVRLVTTMWDDVDAESEVQHTEDNLQIMHWKSLIDAGAHYKRFNNTPESAWEIVHSLGDARKTLPVQGLMGLGKNLNQASSGSRVQKETLSGKFRGFRARIWGN